MPNLTEQQRQAVVDDYLSSLPPGFLPGPVFKQYARVGVMPTVEVGLVRPSEQNEGGTELVLAQRSEEDEHWPGQWHVPGSVVRADDKMDHEHDYDDVIGRVFGEVGGDLEVVRGPRAFDVVRRRGLRGAEITLRLLAEVRGEPERGRFFDARNVLAEPPRTGFVETHDLAIASIARAYQSGALELGIGSQY